MPAPMGYLCVWENCISFRCRLCHEDRQSSNKNRDKCVPFPVYETPELIQGFKLCCARCFGGPTIGLGSLRIELKQYDLMTSDPLLDKMIPVFKRIWRAKYA